jgi:TolB protein
MMPILPLLLAAVLSSPQPGRIAFWSDRDGDPDVFTMNADGTGAQNIGRRGWGDKRASWSPDGSRLVYDSWNVGHAEFDPWLMNADGTGKTQLTTSRCATFSPLGPPTGAGSRSHGSARARRSRISG